jgi:photosystem II stability/assembly factor-like uncharacterized protein
MVRTPFSYRGLGVGLVLAAGLGLGLFSAPSYGEDKTREQEIAELQKEIQALNKKLDDLRKASPPMTPTAAVPEGTIPDEWIKALTWRCIGPAGMGGRITSLSVFEADPTTYWVGTASGGLAKTVNNGITFEHQFDHERTVSVGDVCVAPSNRDIVWVGTGEGNPRNSVSYGDGVYKSTDGGKTWQNMGLSKTFQFGRVRVHPKNPDIVYVGALGRLYGPNEERGLFKTTDGGKTWQKILYVDDKTGVIDMVMHPTDPETLLVALWDRQRDEFDDFLGEPPPPDGIEAYDPVRKYSKAAGIYKTTDGGKSFHKLEKGLPTVGLGRIGLDYYRKNPNVVFAIIDTEKVGTGFPPLTVYMGLQSSDVADGIKLTQVAADGPAAKAGLKVGDVVTAVDGKPLPHFTTLVELLQPHKVGDKLKISYHRTEEKADKPTAKEAEVTLAAAPPPQQGRGQGGAGGAGGRRFLNPGFFAEDAEGGAIVSDIDEQGAAAKAGLKIDDLVTTIDGKPIDRFFTTMGNLANSHQAGDKIKLTVARGAEKLEFEVALTTGGMDRLRGRRPKGHTPRPNSANLGSQRENIQDYQGPEGFQTGGIYQSSDGGETWTRINSLNPRPMYFSQIRVDPTDEKIIYVLGVSMYRSHDGGKTFRMEGNRGVHDDTHAMWIDPRDGRHLIVGCDGGFYQSYDRAEHWDHLNHLALGQFYHVAVDSRPLYRALGGLQDNGSWAGPTRTKRTTGPTNEEWLMIGGGDGFVCRVDPNDPDLVYSESQGGAIQRRHMKTGERASLRPRRVPGKPPFRFNWNTPFILSSHNPSIFYSAGQYVFRSVERGDHLRIISPEITRTKKGSATALAESPMNSEVLYVGTDDGALWVTRDGGQHWTDIAANVKLPGPRWVASIEPSRYVEGRAYVAFDAHRSDDDEPYVYVTEDFGQTWKSLRANLPVGSARVCREDIQNANLLYVGTEFGAWASANRGVSWTKFNNNLPTVAVHEFAQHPTSGEIVVATHGRSLWLLEATPLRQVSLETLKANAHLYQPNSVVRWQQEQGRDGWFSESERKFLGTNPPSGAQLFYSLTKKPEKIGLKVLDHTGKTISELQASAQPGLHRVVWNLSPGARAPGGRRGGGGFGAGAAGGGGGRAANAPPSGGRAANAPPSGGRAANAPPAGGRPGTAPAAPGGAVPDPNAPAARAEGQEEAPVPAFFGGGRQQVRPGVYRIVLTVDGQELSQWLRVEADPAEPSPIITADGEEEEMDP